MLLEFTSALAPLKRQIEPPSKFELLSEMIDSDNVSELPPFIYIAPPFCADLVDVNTDRSIRMILLLSSTPVTLNSNDPPLPSALQLEISEFLTVKNAVLEVDANDTAPPPDTEEQFSIKQLSNLNAGISAEPLTSNPPIAPPYPYLLCESDMLLIII